MRKVEEILGSLEAILSQGIDTYSRADQQSIIQLRDEFIPYKAAARRNERQARSNRDKYWAERTIILKNEKNEAGKSMYTQVEYEGMITLDPKYIELMEALSLAVYENSLYDDKLSTFNDAITLIRDAIKDTEVRSA